MTRFEPDLRSLFDAPVLEQVELVPDFEDHGSSVFRVRTASEHVVVRAFRAPAVDGPFWGCLNALFGIDPRSAAEAASIYGLLGTVSPFPVPRVLRIGKVSGREWLVVELMAGAPMVSFGELSDDGLQSFGRGLASIHARRFATFGNPSGSVRYAPAEFPARLTAALREAAKFHPQGPLSDRLLDDACAAIARLPVPDAWSLVLPDLFPPQFLHSEGQIVAFVDVDAYVIGPRELDLVVLEYFVDARSAALIASGYVEVAPLPELRDVRRAYRLFLWVLTMNPLALDEAQWMAWPQPFA